MKARCLYRRPDLFLWKNTPSSKWAFTVIYLWVILEIIDPTYLGRHALQQRRGCPVWVGGSPGQCWMSRLGGWKNNALEWKSSALFFHLGLSNELFHSERKEEGSRSQKQSEVMFLFSRLMDGPMRRPHRLLNLPEIKTYLFAFSYRVRVWVTDCIHCRHAWTAHSDVISTHKLACP